MRIKLKLQYSKDKEHCKKPDWLKIRLPKGKAYHEISGLITENKLNTICVEAECPNIYECYGNKTAAFLIMGNNCSRNCRFCAVENENLSPLNKDEPSLVAKTVLKLGLKYVLITSVTRDDLLDGGASHFANTISEIKNRDTHIIIEVLTPDFKGDYNALNTVLEAGVDLFNHNIETVPRLYKSVRPEADYRRSLSILNYVHGLSSHPPIKSGIMLGLGEKESEVKDTLKDIFDAGCSIITIGQYLRPSKKHIPVERYVTPEEFDTWKDIALKMGFKAAVSGPLVRSSYNAHVTYKSICE